MEFKCGKEPSAWLPVVMSLVALLLIFIQIATNGFKPEIDEGALARLWQMLVLAQLPVTGLFAFRWLRKAPRQALTVLVAQWLALASAVVPVFVFKW